MDGNELNVLDLCKMTRNFGPRVIPRRKRKTAGGDIDEELPPKKSQCTKPYAENSVNVENDLMDDGPAIKPATSGSLSDTSSYSEILSHVLGRVKIENDKVLIKKDAMSF